MEATQVPETATDAEIQADLARLIRLVETSRIDEARILVEDLAAKWPDSPRMQHWHTVLQPPRVIAVGGWPARSRDREFAWLDAHAHEYPGCWLAVFEDRLIAAEPDLKKVVAAARAELGDEIPLVVLAPDRSK
jgi:Family of unknown function (DUF5678)